VEDRVDASTVKALRAVTDRLESDLRTLVFAPPTAFVYDPFDYARPAWDAYCARYAHAGVDAILLGMNPGPFGMAQTGVPFGSVPFVRDWLAIDAPIGRPVREHPKRPVLGLACPRTEVSGLRLWGFARDVFGTPEAFFQRFFVANYCPLLFLEESGRNRTPDALPAAEREALQAACDRALQGIVSVLRPRMVIGVGAFAEARAREALAGTGVAFARIAHPSPANPAANRGWTALAQKSLQDLGLL
jgi:single-strand selective monofunctional uracil DNA glycosylase